MTILYVILGFVAWWIIGVMVCAFLDYRYYKGKLMVWAKAPFRSSGFGVFFVTIIFPVVIYLHLITRRAADGGNAEKRQVESKNGEGS